VSQALTKRAKAGLKTAAGLVASLAAGPNRRAAGLHNYRVLRGPNRGLVFYTRNPDQSYALGYEPQVSAAIRDSFDAGGVFYDIGANEGWCSLIAARRMDPAGRVFAFEPDATNVAVLERNALRNQAKIDIVKLGVGDRRETVRFASYAGYGLVNHVITPDAPAASDALVSEIELTTIDDFVASSDRPPTLIKIDVEGFELQVLRGARATLASHRPVVICEVRAGIWPEVQALMADGGYDWTDLGGNGRGFEEAGLCDLIFRPRRV
jgi:FkbM family methyltransferase